MKIKKTPEEKRLQKLRSALRLVWSRDYTHRDAIKTVLIDGKQFVCPMCKKVWDKFAARVDHFPPVGSFSNLQEAAQWMIRLFEGPTRTVCKPCHDGITRQQRTKHAKSNHSI